MMVAMESEWEQSGQAGGTVTEVGVQGDVHGNRGRWAKKRASCYDAT